MGKAGIVMQYFGVPTCPYCKKRVNLIRTWSLKRQGEYQCPRCGCISNIFLSPLVYVFALLAVFSGGAVYFFHKFILDDVGLTTCLQVLIPFVLFFLLSLFMVYLAKPVIKRVSREENGKKKQGRPTGVEGRRSSGSSGQTGQIYVDQEDYLPQKDYRTGPLPQSRPVNAPAPQAVRGNFLRSPGGIPLLLFSGGSHCKIPPSRDRCASPPPRRIPRLRDVCPQPGSKLPHRPSQPGLFPGPLSRRHPLLLCPSASPRRLGPKSSSLFPASPCPALMEVLPRSPGGRLMWSAA